MRLLGQLFPRIANFILPVNLIKRNLDSSKIDSFFVFKYTKWCFQPEQISLYKCLADKSSIFINW